MVMQEKEQKVVDVILSKEPESGCWLWAIQDMRQSTLRELEGLASPMIDWLPPENESSIDTILYHMADIEADWPYVEVLEQPLPPEVAALFQVQRGMGRVS
jgi:hypothetical protein